jgi:hypothetical protein
VKCTRLGWLGHRVRKSARKLPLAEPDADGKITLLFILCNLLWLYYKCIQKEYVYSIIHNKFFVY